MPRRAPLLVFAIVAIAAVAWLLFHEGSGQRPAQDKHANGSTAGQSIVSQAKAEDTSDAPPRHPEDSRRESGYRVRVLDPSGAPVGGASLRVASNVIQEHERAWNTAVRSSDQVLWQAASWPEVIADENGEAVLPGPGPVIAAVLTTDQCGHVVCGMDPETYEARGPEDEAAITELQLREASMIELRALDPSGQLLTDGFRFEGRARATEGTLAEQSSQFQWMGSSIGRLPDGRWYFNKVPNKKTQEKVGDQLESLEYRVTLVLGRLRVEQVFEAQEVGPIELRLPAHGDVLLTLQGYPDRVRPYLLESDGDINDYDRNTKAKREGEAFLIERVPIGREYEVRLMTEAHPDDPRGVRRGVGMEPLSILGPQVHGERVERTLVWEPPPGYYGKFVLPEGYELAPWQVFTSIERGVRARVVLAGDLMYTDVLDLSLAPGGEFTAQIPYRIKQLEDPKRLGDVMFEFPDSRPLWAVVPGQLSSFEESIDLGDVQLTTGSPLLRVSVTNENGDPIVGAKITREFKETSSDRQPRWRGGWGSSPIGTNEQGILWISDRDWNTEFGIFPPSRDHSSGQAIEQLRITVSADGYRAEQRELPASTRDLHVVLSPAATVAGSLGPMPARHQVRIGFRESGKELREASPHLLPTDDLMSNRAADSIDFELPSVSAGTWDFVVEMDGWGDRERLRIPSIVIDGAPRQRPEALQNISLGEFVGWASIRFVDADAQPLAMLEPLSIGATVTGEKQRTQPWAHTVRRNPWTRVVPREGIGPVHLCIEGYQPITIERLIPGAQDVVCIPAECFGVTLLDVPELEERDAVFVVARHEDFPGDGITKRWSGERVEISRLGAGLHHLEVQWFHEGEIQTAEISSEDLAVAGSPEDLVIPWPFEED